MKNSLFLAIVAIVFVVLCGQTSCPTEQTAVVVEACDSMLPPADEDGVRVEWRGRDERSQVGCFEVHRAPSSEPFTLDLSLAGDLNLHELYDMRVSMTATVVDKDGGRSPVTITKEVEPANQLEVEMPVELASATVIRLDLLTKTSFPEFVEEGSLKAGFVMPNGDVRPNEAIRFRTAFIEIFPIYNIGETEVEAGEEFLATVLRVSTNRPNFNWAGVDIYAYPIENLNLSGMIESGNWNLHAQDFGIDGQVYPWETEDGRLVMGTWTYQETPFQPIPYEDGKAGFFDISIWLETTSQKGQFYMYTQWADAGASDFHAPTLNFFKEFWVGDVTVH